MAIIGDTYLTAKGFEIANKSANGQSSFTLTRVVSSPNQVSNNPDEIKKLNNLTGEMNTGQIINTDVRSENLTGITVNFLNDIYTNGYDIGSIGIYAKESNSDNEFMYSVTPFLTKQQIPELNNNVFSGYEVTIYLIAGDSQRMNVSLSKGGDASIDLVEKLISNSEAETQKKLDEVNRRVDSLNLGKADKTDLKELQNNVGGDLQNRLTSLNNGKADKVSVYSKSDVDSKDIQTFNSANSYTDQKYNDLSNKNNILSSRLEDYQKPNLIDNEATGNQKSGYTTNLNPQNQILLKAGNTYYLSGKSIDNVIDHVQFNLVKDAWNNDNELYNGENADRTVIQNWATNGKIAITKYYIKKDTLVYPGFCTVFGNGVGTDFCVTQSNDYVPFEVAQQNKASIESEGQLTDDYQAPNLVDDTDNDVQITNNYSSDNGWSLQMGSVQLEKGKKYNVSVIATGNKYGLIFGLSSDEHVNVFYNNNSFVPKDENGNIIKLYNTQKLEMSFIANADTYYIDFSRFQGTDEDTYYRNLVITQTDTQVPYEVAKRNRLWNQRIVNKTNDLSNQLNSHFGTGEIKNGYNLNTYTWDGSFYLNGVDIDTLTGHDGIAPGYNGFYGKMLVDSRNGYVFQTLYDNTNNMWYRYVGNGVQWQHVAKQSDIDNLGTDSTNKFNYMNTIKANTSDMNDHINQSFNQANSYTDQRHDDLNYAKADKYDTYTKDDTDTRIAWAKAELNNNKQDKSDTNNKYAYLANTKEDQSDATNKFNWMNTVKANTDDMNSHIQGAFNQANAHTDDVANSKQDKPGVGTVENGYNLDGFTWYGNFGLFDVNLATLGANLGLNMNYTEFWGYLAVRPNYNAVYQYLYDNMGNRWYRTTGQAWHQTATQDDIASIKANAWRELNVSGQTMSYGPYSNTVLCKINWNTNQALLMGMATFEEGINPSTLTINSSSDFNFTSYASYVGHDGNGGNLNYESSVSTVNGNIQVVNNSGVGGELQFGDQYETPIGVASIAPK